MDQQQHPSTSKTTIQKKWGEAMNAGFVVVPSALLRYQEKLKLEDGEVVVLMNLIMAWWETDKLPYPRTSTIAKRMGVSSRTVQRHIERLEAKGLIQRERGTTNNEASLSVTKYDLSGIVAELKRLGRTEHEASPDLEKYPHSGQSQGGPPIF